ncbi:hypothetical protein TIFTF001_011161 [Ficus carica]|uniref:Glycosyltransferase 61 catalytic domain-containing protein n=1 Tax=Ficus carica TaxID=3494 RepID=A0AA88ADJ8_FICCA|nr:hypothetical protein TIFTF001_011161 [Ficus carica]
MINIYILPTKTDELCTTGPTVFYDSCKVNGPTVLDPTSSTFFLTGPTGPTVGPIGPTCQVQHKAAALVFTAGGYTGNFFHDFNDGLIPLYITINTFFNDHQDDVVLVISKSRDWWVHKYSNLLQRLGLISHGFMTINPKLIPNRKTLIQFRAFLDKSYHQKSIPHKSNGSKPKPSQTRPRLILVSRTGDVGRVLLNQEEIKGEAKKLGFDVVVCEPSPMISLGSAYDLINSSHTMIGIHGAALTHSLFLRPGSVFIQVVPLGVGWLAEVCLGKAAREWVGFRGKSRSKNVMDVYLKEQNVRLDLDRFRGYLKQAYRKSRKFMEREE